MSLGSILAKVVGHIDPVSGELVRAPNPRSLDWMMAPPAKKPGIDALYQQQLDETLGSFPAHDWAPHGEAIDTVTMPLPMFDGPFTAPPVSRSPAQWEQLPVMPVSAVDKYDDLFDAVLNHTPTPKLSPESPSIKLFGDAPGEEKTLQHFRAALPMGPIAEEPTLLSQLPDGTLAGRNVPWRVPASDATLGPPDITEGLSPITDAVGIAALPNSLSPPGIQSADTYNVVKQPVDFLGNQTKIMQGGPLSRKLADDRARAVAARARLSDMFEQAKQWIGRQVQHYLPDGTPVEGFAGTLEYVDGSYAGIRSADGRLDEVPAHLIKPV